MDTALAGTVAEAFHVAHEKLYGYCFRGNESQPVEWVNLRVSAIGPIARPVLPELPRGDGRPARALTGVRPVFFDSWVDTPIYARSGLLPGDEIAGPAVIEEFGSTIRCTLVSLPGSMRWEMCW